MSELKKGVLNLAGIRVFGFGELFLFPAPVVDRADMDGIAARVSARSFDIRSVDGTRLYAWHRRSRGERAVLFFHGNAESLADRIPFHDYLVECGWDVLMVAYRGYPGSEGLPSESGAIDDAHALWLYATCELGISAENLVIHGKSLGGAVSVGLCTRVQPAGLILESTFLSVEELARERFPLARDPVRILKHAFNTRERASEVHCPVLVLHADRDGTVPVAHGRALAPLFRNGRYLEAVGLGHAESLPLTDLNVRLAYGEFLAAVTGGP